MKRKYCLKKKKIESFDINILTLNINILLFDIKMTKDINLRKNYAIDDDEATNLNIFKWPYNACKFVRF